MRVEVVRVVRRVIVTRPAAQAAEWVTQLRQRGIDAVALPLIDIAPVADAAPLVAAWQQLAQQRLVVFVSPNAAEQFFAQRPLGAAWPAGTLAGSPGPGTTGALLARGVPAAQIVEPQAESAQFDSHSLWLALEHRPGGAAAWAGAEVLIVRGDGGREWLADTLRGHRARVVHLAAYRRAAPVFGARELTVMRAAFADPHRWLWFFSSSEAIDHLEAIDGPRPGTAWAEVAALATHPRIAERARALGCGRVVLARPALADVVACIQSAGP